MVVAMRVGVIGCGYQGQVHLDALRAIEGVEIAGVCDLDTARMDEVGERFGVAGRHRDYHELLGAELDLVTICTMPVSHREMALDAFARGAHVLCEKPLAMDAAEAADMLAAARRAQRTLSVGFNMRYMDAALAVREFIAAGSLGQPVCARGFMLADDVPWWGKHYVRRLSGGGALAATAVHMLDLVMWLVGNPTPLTATASMETVYPRKRGAGTPAGVDPADFDVEDVVFGHVRFENGFWLSIEGAWIYDRPGWNYSFDLMGSGGQAHFHPLTLLQEHDGAPRDVTGDRTAALDFPGSSTRLLRDLVADLQAGREPEIGGEQGLVVQALVDALYRSSREGREVAVEVPHVD